MVWRNSGLVIAGTGHYYPRRILTDEVAGRDDHGHQHTDRVLGEVVGQRRHVSDVDETIPMMAAEAARSALRDGEMEAGEVDLLVLSNWTERQFIPELAPQVADLAGAGQALAFDLCGSCAGFVHGVQTAAAFLASPGPWRTAVVVCADQFSRRVRPGSRSETILGDAAGAVVLRTGEGPGLIDSLLLSEGAKWEVATGPAPDGWITVTEDLPACAIGGQLEAAKILLDRNGMSVDDVDWVVPHPGTNAIHSVVREQLGVPEAKFRTNFPQRGNTASASIPIVLSEYRENGTFQRGDLVLGLAIGSGWYSGGVLLHL